MSANAPNSQSYNFTHMYNLKDYRSCNKLPFSKNSIMDVINTNPSYTRFNNMIKLANMEKFYNDIYTDLTVFVPSDAFLGDINPMFFTTMDLSTARNIIRSSTLKRRITYDILSNSPASYFNTLSPINNLFITNISEKTYINNCINVIENDIECSNGIIHVIDGIIYPEMVDEN